MRRCASRRARALTCCAGCEPPHGALEGLDPYPSAPEGSDAADSDALLDAIYDERYAPRAAAPAAVARAFRHAFGCGLVPRFGEPMAASLKHGLVRTDANRSRWSNIDTNLLKMREYFDLYYYFANKASAQQRHVFVVVGDALPAFMTRLLENNTTLQHCWIVALPFEHAGGNNAAVNNRLARLPPKTPPELASSQLQTELYKQCAKIFRPLLEKKL